MGVSKTVAVLLVTASALTGCNSFTLSINYVNCVAYGVVSLRVDSTSNLGTVCGTVTNATANYICDYFDYGTAVGFGTAASKGVPGGTGAFAVTGLSCSRLDGCTYNTNTDGCTHSEDLVLKCSNQPPLGNCALAVGVIVAIVVVVVFFVLILPLICACLCCCVCWCLGAACFASSTPDYGKL